MSRAVLSLGSNLGDRLGYLRLAVRGFGDAVRATSPIYETAPWGVVDQGDFLNAVLIVDDPDIDEWGWLRRGQQLEQDAHRERIQHWGPRTLDVDVVTVEGITSTDPQLLLPHPGTPTRASVLVPWLDIEPDADLPGHGRISQLLAALDPAELDGVRRTDLSLVAR
ncbi:MAG TPA: 2-amino-4-hydroxy-6-hydroxymethyldihydropteridine diphosphokinase [Pseudonocardiaceae bacterium]